MRSFAWVVTAAVTAIVICATSEAREEYAERTGRDCAVCHRSADGGGELRPVGHAFLENGREWPGADGPWWAGGDDGSVLRWLCGAAHVLLVGGWLLLLAVHLVGAGSRDGAWATSTGWKLEPWLLALVVVTGAGVSVLRLGDLRLFTGTAYGLTVIGKSVPAGGLLLADLVLGVNGTRWHRRPHTRAVVAAVVLGLTVVGWFLA